MSIIEGFEEKRLRVIYCCKPAIHYKESDVEALLAHARAVEAQNAELIAMLRKYEWWEGTCLECDQWEPNHLPGCDLDRLIKGGKL